jgi:hypothetical protein
VAHQGWLASECSLLVDFHTCGGRAWAGIVGRRVQYVLILNIVFVLLAIGVVYGALIVPIYNFAIRPVKAGRDIFIVVFAVIFTGAMLQILWSIHSDLHRWLG